jgi:hypothetical protein
MEPLLETIELDREESNELLFKVKVDGLDPAPAKVRLVCEAGDVWYMFNGHATPDDGVVQFIIPPMKDKVMKEDAILSRIEVLIENRYFSPVQFQLRFKKAVTVVAEAVQVPQRKLVPQVSVTASLPVVVAKPAPVLVTATVPKPVIVEATGVPVHGATQAKKPVVTKQATKSAPVKKAPVAPLTPTLKQRYSNKREELVEQVSDDAGEELIKELAQSFIKGKRQK